MGRILGLRRSSRPSGDYPHFGFHLKMNQDPNVIDLLVRDTGWKKIVLYRENLLACWLTSQIVPLIRQGIPVDIVATIRFRFDADPFKKFCIRVGKHREKALQNMQGACYFIEFKESCNEQRVRELIEFIDGGRFRMAIAMPSERRNFDDTLGRFENPGDVVSCLEEIGHPDWVREEIPAGIPEVLAKAG